jgi:hypothetical protein
MSKLPRDMIGLKKKKKLGNSPNFSMRPKTIEEEKRQHILVQMGLNVAKGSDVKKTFDYK